MKKSEVIDTEVVSTDVPTSVHLIEDYKASCEFNDIRNQIDKCINTVRDNYLKLGKLFDYVVKKEYYKQLDYKSFEEFIEGEYCFSRNTANKFIAIYRKFANISDDDSFNTYYIELKPEYKDYNMSQLVELVAVPEDKIKEFKPTMSVKAIRENKAYLKAKEQLENELDPAYPRGALVRLINDLCNSTSYKYPGKKEPVELKLASTRKAENSYYYMEIDFNATLEKFKMSIEAYVYIEGNIRITSPFYMDVDFKDYADGLIPSKKKEFTSKLNDEIKEYQNELEEENKKAFEKERLKRLKQELATSRFSLSDLDTFYDKYNEVVNLYSFEKLIYVIKGIYKFCPTAKFKFNSGTIEFDEKDGCLLDTLDFDGLFIKNVSYQIGFEFDVGYNPAVTARVYKKNNNNEYAEIGQYRWFGFSMFNLYLHYKDKYPLSKILGIEALSHVPEEELISEHRQYFEENKNYESDEQNEDDD